MSFLKSFEARDKALSEDIAKLSAEICGGAPDVLAKMAAWEKLFFERQHAAEVAKGSRIGFEEYMARIVADREQYRRAQ